MSDTNVVMEFGMDRQALVVRLTQRCLAAGCNPLAASDLALNLADDVNQAVLDHSKSIVAQMLDLDAKAQALAVERTQYETTVTRTDERHQRRDIELAQRAKDIEAEIMRRIEDCQERVTELEAALEAFMDPKFMAELVRNVESVTSLADELSYATGELTEMLNKVQVDD